MSKKNKPARILAAPVSEKTALFCERYGIHGTRKDAADPTPDEVARTCHATLQSIQAEANKTITR